MAENVRLPDIMPQFAKPSKDVASIIKSRPPAEFQLEPKYDGFRVLCHIDSPTGVRVLTRTGHRREDNIPHIVEVIQGFFPPGTVVDGEAIAQRTRSDGLIISHFDHVQGVFNSYPDRALSLQEDNDHWLSLVLFDILFLDGEDLRPKPLHQRRKILYESYRDGHETNSPIKLTRTSPATEEQRTAYVDLGYEGVMIKDRRTPYLSGKRGWGWYKLKGISTIDVVIMGFEAGTGMFASTFGAVTFGQFQDGELILRGRCSGMDMATREWMHKNRSGLVGKVMEVAHFGVFGTFFRHPQYRRLRDDKLPEECTWHDA